MRLEKDELVDVARRAAAEDGLTFAAALPLSACGDDRIDAWLDAGFAGEMAYLDRWRDRRREPERWFAPYTSALVFLAPYATTAPAPDPAVGNLARYALGDDYHEVLKAALGRILDRLRAVDPGLEGRALVDTAPVLEKTAAARAGLGWQGKHTNLIREGEGSWFFLAELLVDREAPPPAPARDRCGRCRACIDVCPTGAIVAPYVLDARLCISYLTIELRGAIPLALRPHVGHRIFGCDDCQEVCPWNRFATRPPLEPFRPRDGLRDRTLVDWLAMPRDAWSRTFRRSAVKRARYEGFKRNVAVALGCLADPATIPAIERALTTEPPLVRAHLCWALGRMPAGAGRPALTGRRPHEDDPEVLRELDLALAACDEGPDGALSRP